MTYGKRLNRAVKEAQVIANRIADKACPPMNMVLGDYYEQWHAAYDAAMRKLGWERTGDCLCRNPGPEGHAHEPACGWAKSGDSHGR